ncbi:MAG: HlyD family efflux transporter periplasmic adaptor subunit [Balneolaceae bacterium]|nr:HlyD family efflux transporter periplasmic adaptor subunit [Balneolaceae bacterium]
MQKQLFPEEIIENSQEANFSKHSVRSRVIYSSIVLFLIAAICLLPFIHVDVGVRSQGLIRPVTEVVQLTSPVSGQIQILNATENSIIQRGDIFAVLEAPELSERLRFNRMRTDQVNMFLADLARLEQADPETPDYPVDLESARYRRAWLEFSQKLISQHQKVEQLLRQLERERILFENEAVSEAVLDEADFSWQNAVSQYKLLIEQQFNQWKMDETAFEEELDQLESERIRLQQELSRYEIRSPVTGAVQNTDGIFQNSFVYANQVLGEISPDTSVVAEAYVSPQDVGLLRKGMQVRLQVDAYNHHDWGVVTGKIKDISSDVLMNDGQPLFRVRCSLDQTFLELGNGFSAEIKKGMTFQARFIVARRSLLQLLRDKVDDWLDPSWGENEYASKTEH